jgi:hypothetical protein
MGPTEATSLKPIRVVVASPGDVEPERNRLAAVIEELNSEFESAGCMLRLYRWETDAYPGFHVSGPQGQVDQALKIENCDILIGIFWKRFGTPVSDAGSGTEHEFKIAYERWKASGGFRPRIMLYFRNEPFFPRSGEENEQMGRVLAFRDVHKQEALFCEFAGEIDFERAVRRHLRQSVTTIISPPSPPPEALVRSVQAVTSYDYTVPVGREMFFGREAERDEILAGVKDGRSFAVIGGTRIGKTSLLYEIKRTLFEEVPTAACVAGPVFLSAHQFETLTQTAIYRQVMQDFEKNVCAVRFPQIRLADSPLYKGDLTDVDAFSRFKETLKGVVRLLGQKFRIVILLDEVDVLQHYPWSMTFFNNIRSLTQAEDQDLKSISWVIAGTLAIDSLYKVAGSPFLNVISAALRLGPLSRDAASQLIQKPTDGRVPADVAEAVYTESGGHPFLVQYLMSKCLGLSGADPAALTCSHVSRAVEWFFDKRSDFEFWTSRFNRTDDAVYGLVAEREREVPKSEIIRKIVDPPAVNHSLALLAHCGIIRETARNRYCYSGEMFRRWFSENRMPFEGASSQSSD